MILPEKMSNALYALNGVLVLARAMAAEGRSGQEVADVLDVAEYLPRLFIAAEDRTEHFRRHLVDLIKLDPRFQLAVDRFDNPVPARW